MFEFNNFPATQSIGSVAGGAPYVDSITGNLVENFFREQDKFFETLVVTPTQKSSDQSVKNIKKANDLEMIVIGGIVAFFILKAL